MSFKLLKNYIKNKMRMSHIYQPVMIKSLIKNNGKNNSKNIAKEFLTYDPWAIKYYEDIVKIMPGKVLTKNLDIILKNKDLYFLKEYNFFSNEQKQEIIKLCEEKIDSFLKKRGKKTFEHRSKSSGKIPGSIRWQVLERAKTRCESCGISNEIKALEVDHILPKSLGGKDELSNFQALCFSCNSMKKNKSKTDFRKVRNSFNERVTGCLFCKNKVKGKFIENELAYATFDSYPVSKYHTLIIPKRHVKDYFGLFQAEVNSCNNLIKKMREIILKKDKKVLGFNVGMNAGKIAGQTIMHCHIHLIPRRKGDVKNPQGGVRAVISSKQHYVRKK